MSNAPTFAVGELVRFMDPARKHPFHAKLGVVDAHVGERTRVRFENGYILLVKTAHLVSING